MENVRYTNCVSKHYAILPLTVSLPYLFEPLYFKILSLQNYYREFTQRVQRNHKYLPDAIYMEFQYECQDGRWVNALIHLAVTSISEWIFDSEEGKSKHKKYILQRI